MKRVEIRIPKKFVDGKWKYDMPEGGRRVDDEVVTTEVKSSKYGVLKQSVEFFVIADVPDTGDKKSEEEQEPTPTAPPAKNKKKVVEEEEEEG